MAGLYDLDIEAELFDDVAIGWDDPDLTPASIQTVAIGLTSETDTALAMTAHKRKSITPPYIVGVAVTADLDTTGGGTFNLPDTTQADFMVVFVASNDPGTISIDDFGASTVTDPGGAGVPAFFFGDVPTTGGGEPNVVNHSLNTLVNVIVIAYRGERADFDVAIDSVGTGADPPNVTVPDDTHLVLTLAAVTTGFQYHYEPSGYDQLGAPIGSLAGAMAAATTKAAGTSFNPGIFNVTVGTASVTVTYVVQANDDVSSSGGRLLEFDSALSMTPVSAGQSVGIGLASETDTALAMTVRKTKAIGLASETDSSLGMTARKTAALGLTTETDSAQSMTARKTAVLGIASETDTAQSMTRHKRKLLGETLLVVDLFDRADAPAPGLGADYVAPGWRLEDEMAVKDGGNDYALRDTDLGTSDHWAQIRVVGTPGVQNPSYTVVVAGSESTSEQNSIIGFIEPGGSKQAQIGAYQGGSFVGILGGGTSGLDISGTYTLRLRIDGLTAYLYYNDILVHTQDLSTAGPGSTPATLGNYAGWAAQNTSPPIDDFQAAAVVVLAETDTALSITPILTEVVSIGLASETDTAQPFTVRKTAAIGLASETDAALPMTARKTAALGLASETDTALSIVRSNRIAIGLASETDTAQPMTVRKTAAIGLASETDTAQSMAVRRAVALNTATETDTALPMTARKTVALGLASETDSALSIVRSNKIAVGLASETDTAQPMVAHKTKAIGLATEADTALSIQPPGMIREPIETATETDVALPMTPRKTKALGLVSESDSAQSMAVRKTRIIGMASETDLAQGMGRLKVVAIGTATETDLAQAMNVVITRVVALAQASETDTALAMSVHKIRSLGLAIESDLALAILPIGGQAFLEAHLELSLVVPGLELVVLPMPLVSLDLIGGEVTLRSVAGQDVTLEILVDSID